MSGGKETMEEGGFAYLTGIAVRTAIVLLLLLLGLRLTGQRQVGELNLRDVLLVLLLSNAVQNAMTRGDGRLTVALTSSTTLILLGWLCARLLSRHPSWEGLAVGVPVILIENGRK